MITEVTQMVYNFRLKVIVVIYGAWSANYSCSCRKSAMVSRLWYVKVANLL